MTKLTSQEIVDLNKEYTFFFMVGAGTGESDPCHAR
jgi:hypothetical protein